MISIQAQTYEAKIYIAGPIEAAKQVIRRECSIEGLCVTIEPTTYIYTKGEESGYVVGFINYPRFSKTPDEIFNKAVDLGVKLMNDTYQGSFTIVATDRTQFFSTREQDK